MSPTRTRLAIGIAAALALATPLALANADAATTPATVRAASAAAPAAATSYTPAEVLAGIQKNSTSATQVNTKPHINTMTRAQNVNVYQVASGVYAYTSSMAIDTDGSDSDPDPDHQGDTTWQDSNGQALGAHHVPFYVLGDDCWDRTSPCPHFFYKERGMSGRQFALMFYNGKVIGSIFGDTQTANNQTTSDNDSRELGEASVKAAQLLGIPSSGTTGGVDSGVTVVMFSGSSWVVNGTNATLNDNAQALVQKALDTLGSSMAGGTPPSSPPPSSPPPTTPPTGGNKSYEAEAAALAGGTTVTNCAHCSGGKKLSYLGNGGTATFTGVTEPTAGSYTMTVSFMSVGQARSAVVTVNGVNQTVSFPETPDYNTVVTKNVTVQLKAGSNTIEFSNPTAGAPNLDRIVV
ncbi:glycoside hydrolase family 75 protein [Streptacidiphilus sp. N1-10]|uniref:Glycoside hydrolase family 75 protein n=1 Tax=Streptacidiphilus jeojiensis TaxID=3229225 RepID=A0ABV6XFK6_9ACTN